MAAVDASFEDAWAARAVRDLTRARRRNRAADVDIFEGFYQAYLTAFGCAIAVLLGSDAVGDLRVDHQQLASVIAKGPAAIGLAVAIVCAISIRSGSRGGPLVLPAADVRHVLLAPVPRNYALRSPAIRQIRFSAFVGLVAGAGLAVLASHRLPGSITAWIPVGGAVGAGVGALAAGSALAVCGRRLRPWMGLALAALVIGWSGVDVATGRDTSPLSFVGQLALLPARFHPGSVAVAALVVVVVAIGVLGIGGMSLEQAERRATLASQIRFALTLQDLRTVVLLRRQLTQEQSRPRPWIRLGPLARRRQVVWHRDLRGVTRWPAVRIARLILLGAAAGAAVVGVWGGTTPLIVVAALALFLAGLEALEPMAQDVDHPDLPASTPVVPGRVRLSHAVVPFVVILLVTAVGWATAIVMGVAGVFKLGDTVALGPALMLPAALLTLVGASASVVMEPPAGGSDILPAEIASIKMVLRAVWSPAIVLLGLTPVLIARSAVGHHLAAPPAAVSGSILPLMAGLLGLAWLRFREDIHEYMKMPAAAAKPDPKVDTA